MRKKLAAKKPKSDETDFLNEMEMRSAYASYVSNSRSEDPWFTNAFKRRQYDSVIFCLRMLYGFKEADAGDLYQGVPDSERSW